jgi:uncharacterized membrane protein
VAAGVSADDTDDELFITILLFVSSAEVFMDTEHAAPGFIVGVGVLVAVGVGVLVKVGVGIWVAVGVAVAALGLQTPLTQDVPSGRHGPL